MSKYKPGDIITIKGTEFAVLDVEEGTAKEGKEKLFVLLKEPVGSTAFSRANGSNDYTNSTLHNAVDEWFKKYKEDVYNRLIYSRDISLLTVDGHINYGVVHPLAAPLTFDEYRMFSKYIPKCEEASWLASGYGGKGYFGAGAAMRIQTDGSLGYCGVGVINAIRPAMWVSEKLDDEPREEKTELSEYSTMALLQELVKREMMRDE